MNPSTKIVISFLLMMALVAPAAAEDNYQAKIVVSGTQGAENNWVSEMWDLNLSTTKSFMDVSITFIRIGVNNQSGWFSITGSGVSNPALVLTEGADEECVRGACKDNNNVTGNEKSIKIMLIDIKQISSTTETTTTTSASSNPIYAYVYVDRELPLTKDKVYNFDGQKYTQQTGWTTEGGISKIDVYFQRRELSLPMSIKVQAESTEPKVSWGEKTAKYTIETNGKYTFTVKYETKNSWGWKEEFVEVYTLVINGIESKSSSKTIAAISPYDVTAGTAKTIIMAEPGTFDPQQGATITDNGDKTHTFRFTTPGNYDFNFKGKDGGTAKVSFRVAQATETGAGTGTSTGTGTDTGTTTANQQQPSDGDTGSNILYYVILVIAFILLAWMLLSRRKGSQKYQVHPKPQ